jgi:antagonist of KipI
LSIRIIHNGISDTIQDAGRYGFAASGINPGGAMDLVAMQVANLLAGNNKDEAAIEMHFPAAVFHFTESCLIATSGADFNMHVNDQPLPLNTPIIIAAGSIVECKKLRSGARCYLAVHGGFDIQPWLNSYSTNLKANAGGFNGRSFKKEDILTIHHSPFTTHNSPLTILPWHADVSAFYEQPQTIRILPGNEFDQLQNVLLQFFKVIALR